MASGRGSFEGTWGRTRWILAGCLPLLLLALFLRPLLLRSLLALLLLLALAGGLTAGLSLVRAGLLARGGAGRLAGATHAT